MADVLVVGRPATAGPRTRPEAIEIANKHVGRQMAQNLHDYNNKSCATRNFNTRELRNRPSTAQLVSGGGNSGDHPLSLSVAPRVKPEAESIYKKNRGTLTQIYAEYNSVISKNKDLTRTDPDKQIQNRKQNDAMKGPIMTDPTYKNYITSPPPQPRIKSEAENTAKLGVNGSIGRILLESYDQARMRNMESSVKKSGNRVRNHTAANKRRIREVQARREVIEGQKVEPTPVKALWRSKTYDSIPGRIRTGLKKVEDVRQEAPRNEEVGLEVGTQTKISDNELTIVVERPQKCETPRKPTPRTTDFIHKNRNNMSKIGANRRSKVINNQEIRNRKNHDCEARPQTAPGLVPKYLKSYQSEWKEQEALEKSRIIDPECPSGHQKMPECERRDMVQTLLDTQAELHKQLATMGSKDTLRNKQTKEGIVKRLTEVDEAMRVFGRRKVFVKVTG